MKSKAIKMSVLALLGLVASASGFAATQGVAGATSTGSFTNTFGSVTATQVRVFGLQDSTLTSTSGIIVNPFGGVSSGVMNSFCVAHSTGGDVRLTFSSPGINGAANDFDLMATNSATGAKMGYHQYVAKANANGISQSDLVKKSSPTIDIASASTDLVNCTTPNVNKGIVLLGYGAWDAKNVNIYTDVVTVTATPR